MPTIEDLIQFLVAAILLGLSPGPDNIFVLSQSALYGRAAGISVTLGLCTGLIGHTLAVAIGVAALIKQSPQTFTIIKLIGAAYLLYLAIQAIRASFQKSESSQQQVSPASRLALYRRGVIMNITNPKVTMFFLAFLPPFVNETRGPLFPQFILLGGLFILATLLVFGAIACLAGTIGDRLKSPAAQQWLNRMTAIVLIALAAILLFEM